MHACSVAQLCLTLCKPTDCSPPGSSVHEISWARILEWIAIPFSMMRWLSYMYFYLFLRFGKGSIKISNRFSGGDFKWSKFFGPYHMCLWYGLLGIFVSKLQSLGQIWPITCFFTAFRQEWLFTFLSDWGKKSKEGYYFMICENYLKSKFQCP